MACITEEMGLSLPGCATALAGTARKTRIAKESGVRIVELIKENKTARQFMTKESFDGTWFYTGDLFSMDEEGNYYYVERKSEVIFSGGEKVFPAEVEEILCQHPKVEAAVIVGIPDRVWGEIVRAFIVPSSGQKITPDEITDWCSGKMASYKKPREIVIKQKLPVAEDGKILRSALKDLNSGNG